MHLATVFRVASTKRPNRRITPADQRAADNLKRLWKERKKALGLTQEKVAQAFGDKTQGLISQYITGRIALGAVATLRFARVLKCSPQEIRPDIQFSVVSDDLSPEAIRFAYKWLSLPPRFRRDVERHLDSLIEAGATKYEDFLAKLEGTHPH